MQQFIDSQLYKDFCKFAKDSDFYHLGFNPQSKLKTNPKFTLNQILAQFKIDPKLFESALLTHQNNWTIEQEHLHCLLDNECWGEYNILDDSAINLVAKLIKQ